VYKYQFTSTVEDLLEAEEAERTVRSISAPFRWLIAVLGVAWLTAGVLAFDWSNLSWRPVVWLLLGIGIIYYFIFRPYMRRSKIKESNVVQQGLVLEFNDDCIILRVNGVGVFERSWEELVEFVGVRKGILFYFSDGVANWIPDRVFSDVEERSKFIKFLREHQNQE
jgi:hypothetical protein